MNEDTQTHRLLFLASITLLVIAIAGSGLVAPAGATGTQLDNTTTSTTPQSSPTPDTVTLITGERAYTRNNTLVSDSQAAQSTTASQSEYAIPTSYNSSVHDKELYNVSRVERVTQMSHSDGGIPVLVTADNVSQLRSELNVTIRHTYEFTDTVAITVRPTEQQLTADTLADAGVTLVTPDRVVTTSLSDSVDKINATSVRNTAGVTGNGINISIIDSGIDRTHEDLNGRVIIDRDFVTNQDNTGDPNGHGTHVASTAAGDGTVHSYRTGVAPEANLFDMRVLDSDGAGFTSDVAAGITKSTNSDADIISLSLSTGTRTTLVTNSLDNAADEGIVIVAAAGNQGPESETIGRPAGHPDVIAVGSDDTLDRGYQSDIVQGSSRGPAPVSGELIKPELTAPGLRITAAGSRDASSYPYTTKSGTSMAAPHVSGAVALLLEHDNTLTPDEVRARLMSTATPLNATVFEQGAGQVDIYDALTTPIVIDDADMTVSFTDRGLTKQHRVITVSNTGTDTVTLSANGSATGVSQSDTNTVTVSPGTVTLAPGDTRDVQIGIAPTGTASGFYSGAVTFTEQTPDGSRVVGQSIIVQENPTQQQASTSGAFIDLTNISVSTPGQSANGSVGYTAVNTGYSSGTDTITVTVDGQQVSRLSRTVSVAAGERHRVSFPYNFSEVAPGESFDLTVTSSNASSSVFSGSRENESANLSATITQLPPESVIAGQSNKTIAYEIANTGYGVGEETVSLRVAGQPVHGAVQNITVQPGQTVTGSFSYDFGRESYSGSTSVSVAVSNTSDPASATVTVDQPGQLAVSITNVTPEEAVVGQNLTVEFTLNNPGDVYAGGPVRLLVNDTRVDELYVESLRPHTTRTNNTVSYQPGPTDPPAVPVAVRSPDETANTTVTVSEAPNLSFTASLPETVTQNSSLVIPYQVTNNGPESTTETITLTVDGVQTDATTTTINSGQSTSGTLSYPTDGLNSSTLNVSVSVGEQSVSQLTTVNTPPVFDLVLTTVSTDVRVGQNMTVEYHVTNSGDLPGTQNINFRVNDTLTATHHNLTVQPGASTTGSFSYTPTQADRPAVSLTIASANLTTTPAPVTVQAEPPSRPDSAQQVSTSAPLIGTLANQTPVTVSATGVTTDGIPSCGDTVTFTVGGTAVSTTTTANGTATATLSPTDIELSPQEQEQVAVGLNQTPVATQSSLEVVHEVRNLSAGENPLSIPQPATLTTTGISSVTTWNSSTQTYTTVTQPAVRSSTQLHRGVYAYGESADARLGLTFGSNNTSSPTTTAIRPGWNLVGSNFALDSRNATTPHTLSNDLTGVPVNQVDVYNAGLSRQLHGTDTVGPFQAYWVYSNTTHNRNITHPGFTPPN